MWVQELLHPRMHRSSSYRIGSRPFSRKLADGVGVRLFGPGSGGTFATNRTGVFDTSSTGVFIPLEVPGPAHPRVIEPIGLRYVRNSSFLGRLAPA